MTTPQYKIDVTATRTLLTALHVRDHSGHLDAPEQDALATYAPHITNLAGELETFDITDGGAGATIEAILTALWAARLITGPAEPHFFDEDDQNEAYYRLETRLSIDAATLNLVTGSIPWKYLIARDDEDVIDQLLHLLRNTVEDLNHLLAQHDRYLAAARAESLPIPVGRIGVKVDDRIVATIPVPQAEDEFEFIGLHWHTDTAKTLDVIGIDVWRDRVTVGHWPDGEEWFEALEVDLSALTDES